MNKKYYIKYWLFNNKKNLVTREFQSVFDIKYKKNTNLLIFDVDDTLGEHNGVISDKTIGYLYDLSRKGHKIALISNGNSKRAEYLRKKLRKINPTIITKSDKPNPISFYEIFRLTESENANVIVVGDRIATDLFGAYLAGIRNRYLVSPYSDIFGGKKPSIVYRFIRALENFTAKGK